MSIGAYGLGPFALAAVWWARRHGLVIDHTVTTYALLLVAIGTGNVLCTVATRRWPTSRGAVHARAAAASLGTAVFLYAAGWGPALAIAYALGNAELLRTIGARTMRANLFWNCVAIAAGQLAIATGVTPSLLPHPLSHAVALGGACLLVAVTKVLGDAATAIEDAEDAARERAAHFEALIAHARDLICVVSPDGVLVSVSPAVTPMLGYEPSAIVGLELADFVEPGRGASLPELLARAASCFGDVVDGEIALRHADGRRILVELACVAPGPSWDGCVVLNVHDVTTQRLLESQLRHDARHDTLTGLLNRKAFAEVSDEVCREASAAGNAVGMLYIDLDGFKVLNDTYGHEAGDRVLREVARRIGRCLTPSEALARLGGDEFAVIVANADSTRPAELADLILAELAAPIGGFPGTVHVGASIGLALRTDEGIEMSALLGAADAAMYAAKRSGRRRWVMDEPAEV